jgi:hypothetical protein
MRLPLLLLALALPLLAPLLAPLPARAGGEGYDGSEEADDAGPVFFGVVRDTRGLGVAGAEVLLTPKQGEAVTLKTNVLGIYRAHVAKDTPPDQVEVTCSKAGYRQSALVRRGQANAKANETNCTLQRL